MLSPPTSGIRLDFRTFNWAALGDALSSMFAQTYRAHLPKGGVPLPAGGELRHSFSSSLRLEAIQVQFPGAARSTPLNQFFSNRNQSEHDLQMCLQAQYSQLAVWARIVHCYPDTWLSRLRVQDTPPFFDADAPGRHAKGLWAALDRAHFQHRGVH